MEVKEEQKESVRSPIMVTLSGSVIVSKEVHLLKAPLPIMVTVSGIVIEDNNEQL